jgi:hypothetical protein
MSLSLAIAINVLADLALLGGLAYVMWQPVALKPHAPAREDLIVRRVANADRRSWRRPRRAAPAPTRVA